MNQETNNKSTSKEVLDKIKKGELKKHSKFYFIFKGFVYGLGLVSVIVFSVVLGSFIIFFLRASGLLFLPKFGFSGLRILLSSFPWFLGLIVLTLVLLIGWLVKKSPIVYRKPLIYSILAIFILILLSSFLFEKTRFHTALFKKAQNYKLPLIGSAYRGCCLKQIKNTYIGKVTELAENGFYFKTRGGQDFNVVFSKKTHFPFGRDIKVGDLLIVMGERQNSKILASGVRKIEDIDNLCLPHMNYKLPKRFMPI